MYYIFLIHAIHNMSKIIILSGSDFLGHSLLAPTINIHPQGYIVLWCGDWCDNDMCKTDECIMCHQMNMNQCKQDNQNGLGFSAALILLLDCIDFA